MSTDEQNEKYVRICVLNRLVMVYKKNRINFFLDKNTCVRNFNTLSINNSILIPTLFNIYFKLLSVNRNKYIQANLCIEKILKENISKLERSGI